MHLIQHNELFDAVVAFAVLVFAIVHFRRLSTHPNIKILLFSYGILFVGWVVTILEGVLWPNVLNTVEHICYALSSVLFSLWCWLTFRPGVRNRS